MTIRGSVVSLRFIFPHPPEDEQKKKIETKRNETKRSEMKRNETKPNGCQACS